MTQIIKLNKEIMTKEDLQKYPTDWIIDEFLLVIKDAEALELENAELRNKITIPIVGNCTDCNVEINYKGLCEICHTEYMLKD